MTDNINTTTLNSTKQTKRRPGRPKKSTTVVETVDEAMQGRLSMEEIPTTIQDSSIKKDYVTIDEVTQAWRNTFAKFATSGETISRDGIGSVAAKWNKLNPFLQNQRIKDLYSRAQRYDKANIGKFLESPGSSEKELRSLGWANSSAQQIYYNILRRSCDIPNYYYYVIPELLAGSENYKNSTFENEDRLVHNWLETFNVPNTLKTIALEVKREGKSSYLLRNQFVGSGSSRKTSFCTLQKLPTDWIKIVGKGQLGYIVSFNMMYFLNIANNPSDFGDFIVQAWEDMVENGIVGKDVSSNQWKFHLEKSSGYSFNYAGKTYTSFIESYKNSRDKSYMFWLRMPDDLCYTFGSDNSQPWAAPDTMGLMLKLQELTDYGQLAGLIASTPLTAVLTGEIETIAQPRAGKNESVYAPEVLRGYMDQFNSATSTNVEMWLVPGKNVKLQQLSADVNSSEIISTATQNFLESAGEGGLTIATDKPNVAQVTAAKQLVASQQRYVTLQFEQVLNFILQNKLGFKYEWKIRIWGDVFNSDNDKKHLKEIVANGNIALLPKLMSAEGISMRDTKALTEYIKTFDFYKDFVTYSQLKNSELQQKSSNSDDNITPGVGRPPLEDGNIQSDATAASRDRGDNISDNRI